MIRYDRNRMQPDAASVKAMKARPEQAERSCIAEQANDMKKEEPTEAGTSGLSDRPSSTLNQDTIEQKPEVGNKHSALSIHTGSALVNELESELNTTRLRDEDLGIKPGETVSGTLEARNAGIHWRFLDRGVNFIEPGSSYHGEFIARVVKPSVFSVHLALIGWRPVFGESQDYVRFAQFSRRIMETIQLPCDMRSKLGLELEDMVEFVARVTVYNDFVEFQIPIARLKLHHNKNGKEGQANGNN